MTQRLEVPEGCRQVEFPDGTSSRVAKDGAGLVEISDRQAAMLRNRKTDLKVIGVQVGGFSGGAWRDCARCPRSFLGDGDHTLCPRCRAENNNAAAGAAFAADAQNADPAPYIDPAYQGV